VKSYGSNNVKNHYVDLALGSRSWNFLGSSVTILRNIIPIHAFGENLWPGQCLNHYEHSDLDLWTITLDQGHDTSCEILFKFIKRVRSYSPDKLFAYVVSTVYSDLDLWPVTLDQDQDTSLGPV
jgi:hypothetical protein